MDACELDGKEQSLILKLRSQHTVDRIQEYELLESITAGTVAPACNAVTSSTDPPAS